MTETGESSRAIRQRAVDEREALIISALRDGATLHRPPRLSDFFTDGLDEKDPRNGRWIAKGWVRKHERSGLLVRVGVDRYGLNSCAPEHDKQRELPL